jgi:2-methylisocitrate lyase-like PEP mutase family enzyme
MKPCTRLKTILASRSAAILPGTANALFARVIARHGFPAVYVTGAGIANMSYGLPDIGLVTLAELADHVAAIADAVECPILVDADTGFGNPLNVIRTVQLLERAGAAGIQLEDQVFPKKCGHFAGKQVIARAEMVQKIKAACDARHDGDLQIVARTDARAIEGIEAARAGAGLCRGGGGRDLRGGAARDRGARADRARACRSADRQHGIRRADAAGIA